MDSAAQRGVNLQSYTIRGAGDSFQPAPHNPPMSVSVRQFLIHGVTESGKRFRPSDWAERLAGVMAQFRPPGSRASHLTYSPYVLPVVIDGVRGVVVDQRLRELAPLAYKFVVDFARDNQLKTEERE